MKREWSPDDVARRVWSGAVVKLGQHLILWLDRGVILVMQCQRCRVEERLRRDVAERSGEHAHFLERHQHAEMPS